MKVMKAMKKLKFWSRKKRKKRAHFLDHPPPPTRPPPPPPHQPLYWNCHWQYQHPVQPSAPPLPEWLEYEQSEEAVLISEVNTSVSAGMYHSSEAQFAPRENDSERRPENPVVDAAVTSYQQYMIPNPVYGIPAVHESTKEKTGGVFGRVFNIFCCIFPCFKPN